MRARKSLARRNKKRSPALTLDKENKQEGRKGAILKIQANNFHKAAPHLTERVPRMSCR